MPRQTRVTPFGEIVALPDRGTFMGNRGVLHDASGHIKRAWQLQRWIVCVLEFRCRHRAVMTPGRYTELFFLDEATALAAGHRPCAECRHARFVAYCHAWQAEHHQQSVTADAIDRRLHSERIAPDRAQRTHQADLARLPDGVMVAGPDDPRSAYLVWGAALLRWTASGYVDRRPRPRHQRVTVLTPPSTVAALRAGYVPEIHPSLIHFL